MYVVGLHWTGHWTLYGTLPRYYLRYHKSKAFRNGIIKYSTSNNIDTGLIGGGDSLKVCPCVIKILDASPTTRSSKKIYLTCYHVRLPNPCVYVVLHTWQPDQPTKQAVSISAVPCMWVARTNVKIKPSQ